jgi:hypothetical protein
MYQADRARRYMPIDRALAFRYTLDMTGRPVSRHWR